MCARILFLLSETLETLENHTLSRTAILKMKLFRELDKTIDMIKYFAKKKKLTCRFLTTAESKGFLQLEKKIDSQFFEFNDLIYFYYDCAHHILIHTLTHHTRKLLVY